MADVTVCQIYMESQSICLTFTTFTDIIKDLLHSKDLIILIFLQTNYNILIYSLTYISRTRSLTGAISSSFNLTTLFLALKFYDSLAAVIGYDGVFW